MKWRLAGFLPAPAKDSCESLDRDSVRVSIHAAAAVSILLLSVSAWAQEKRALNWTTDTQYLGSVTLQSVPYPGTPPNGDHRSGKGLAVRRLPTGQLVAYTGSWNPQVILEWSLPWNGSALTGTQAVFKRNLGTCAITGELYGLYWDPISDDLHDGHLYCSSNANYDSDVAIAKVLSRSYINESTGKLVSEGQWKFQRRTYPYAETTAAGSGSDKAMHGNVVAVPTWFRVAYGLAGRLAATATGYESIVATGPAFMTTGLAVFDPPVSGSTATIVARSALGHPYTAGPSTDRTWRNTNYVQEYAGDSGWPRIPAGDHGFSVWGDKSLMLWVDTLTLSSPISFETWNEGRAFYGKNATPPTDGKPAALNSEYGGFYVRTYNPVNLGYVVFGGIRQDKVQGTWGPLRLPGVPYPMSQTAQYPGFPHGRSYQPLAAIALVGAAFESVNALIVVDVRNVTTTAGRPVFYLWQVRDVAASPSRIPAPPSLLRTVT